MNHPVALTLLLLAALGAVFLKGFREAIGLAVPIVAVYLVLNAVVIGWGLIYLAGHPDAFAQWSATALCRLRQSREHDDRPRCSSFRSWRSACRASKPASR